MSHEIRTPLNGIIGFTEILLRNPKIEQDELSQLNIIKRSSDILLVLINDILDISKIDSGKIILEEIEININEIIKHVIENFKQKTESKNIEIKINSIVSDDTVFIGDPVRISQILLNLINNSLKFTPDNGEISISIKQEKINSAESSLFFEIKDSGIGIPQDKLKSIFEPFIQSGSDTSRKYGGTGLGLSIVKKFIELMNGTIRAESEIGKGSVFLFNINLKEKEIK
jgi:signal transduction histidine kinase